MSSDGEGLVPLRVRVLGESALVLEYGERIDDSINARVLAAWRALRTFHLPGVLDLVPAYATLTVFFDALAWEPEALAARLGALLGQGDAANTPASRCIEIPVCYAPEHAPDTDAVCTHTGLAMEELIRRHTAPAYRVCLLGFAPGFPYLSGLDPGLATPRRATPRLRVPAGSVAIGGAQTGVYPQVAPGGWQLIGCTPSALFDAERAPPCLLMPGDTVRFVSIDALQFARLASGAGQS